MHRLLLPTIGMLAIALASGCDNAKSRAAVASDVANAQQQASTEVAAAREDAAKTVDSVAASTGNNSTELKAAAASAAYDVEVVRADGEHNVAVQQCSALVGTAQSACKEKADSKFEQAQIHANVIRLSKIQ
jgi:hypothetical protein